jgi:hypothetical protein
MLRLNGLVHLPSARTLESRRVRVPRRRIRLPGLGG